MAVIVTTIVYLILIVIIVVLSIAGFINICRAAACIINEHERAYGTVKWKWFIFIDKNTEMYYDAEAELNDLEEELKNRKE